MLKGYNPTVQALFGTLFTWGSTAVGAALVFFLHSSERWILDGSLGFAAGIMTAASYWSLLAPAIDIAKDSGNYGANGEYAFVPAGIGFLLGAIFVYGADKFIDSMELSPISIMSQLTAEDKLEKQDRDTIYEYDASINQTVVGLADTQNLINRRTTKVQLESQFGNSSDTQNDKTSNYKKQNVRWRRLLLLIIAITVHNIPEGLAVGVGFAAVNKSKFATFEKARNLAIGIGIQNFPEGLAVSLPLRSAGVSLWKSFWYGQLSGMVEPIAGVLGALLLGLAEPFLPYALAFAAGAMIYVVVDDIIPEAHSCGNGTLSSWGAIIGFWIMMSLDVGLG